MGLIMSNIGFMEKNKGASYEIEINDGGLIMNNIAFTEKNNRVS